MGTFDQRTSSTNRRSRREVAVLHLPRVIHHVLGSAADEELDRIAPRRFALGVIGANGLEVLPPKCRELGRCQPDPVVLADRDLAPEVVRSDAYT